VRSAVGLALALLLSVDGAILALSPLLIRDEATFWVAMVAQMAASAGSAFVAARLAPRNNLRAGLALTLPAAALWVAHSVATATHGNGAAALGLAGHVAVVAMALGLNLVLCGVGAAVGDWQRHGATQPDAR
jgi:hypothetical protein